MAAPALQLVLRRHAAWWTLAAGLFVTAALGWTLHHEAVEIDRQRLIRRASEIQSQLDTRLEKSEMLLHNLRDYLMLSGESQEPVFAKWCYENGLTINCPWILGVAVATNRNEVDLRQLRPKPPALWSQDDWESIVVLKNRVPVQCHLSLRSNVTNGQQFLADYDLRCEYSDRTNSSPSISRNHLVSAILGSRLGMSERQVIMWGTNRNKIIGTLYYVPIYRPGLAEYLASPAPIEHHHRCARWLHLSGLIVAPVDFKRLVESFDTEVPDLGIEIFSSTNRTDETWLNRDRAIPRACDPGFRSYLTHSQSWPMYGNRFSIFFYTTPLFEAQSPRRLAKTAVVAGLAVTLLSTALVGVSVHARNHRDQLAAQIGAARDALAAAQRGREKISRDLHDGTIQSLYAIQLGLARTAGRLRSEPTHAGSELMGIRQELDSVIAEIRQFITEGAEAERTVNLGLVLQAVVQRARAGTTVRIDLHCDPEASTHVTGDQAVQLANIAREALSNALRHGRPTQVTLGLRLQDRVVTLEVADDGCGFDPAALTLPGVGLASMSARAKDAGGTLDILSSSGQGTRIVVKLPMRAVMMEGADLPISSMET